jgi:hypothetical protein
MDYFWDSCADKTIKLAKSICRRRQKPPKKVNENEDFLLQNIISIVRKAKFNFW